MTIQSTSPIEESFKNQLSQLAKRKSFHTLAVKKGKLCEINLFSALIEKIKGKLGFSNSTDAALVEKGISSFLEKGFNNHFVTHEAKKDVIYLVGRLRPVKGDRKEFFESIFKLMGAPSAPATSATPVSALQALSLADQKEVRIRPIIIYNLTETKGFLPEIEKALQKYESPIFLKTDFLISHNHADLKDKIMNLPPTDLISVALFLYDEGPNQRNDVSKESFGEFKDIANMLKDNGIKDLPILSVHYRLSRGVSMPPALEAIEKFNQISAEVFEHAINPYMGKPLAVEVFSDMHGLYQRFDPRSEGSNAKLLDDIFKNSKIILENNSQQR